MEAVVMGKDESNFVISLNTMSALAKNYDILCYHLKVVHKSLNHPIREKVDTFLQGVRADLLSNQPTIEDAIENKFSDILNLRLIALKWLFEEENLSELLDNEAYPYFERMAEVGELSGLSDNILFALRSNKKVVDALLAKFDKRDFLYGNALDIPEISYDQLKVSIYLAIPDNDSARAMLDWLNCSLRIEYIICAAALIYDEQLKISPEKINQLSSIIVDAAQTYSAIAVEAGIIYSRKKFSLTAIPAIDDADSLAEQKRLAEAGISTFAQNWKD